jgi:quercetin dioxygenase-like cupin family protein
MAISAIITTPRTLRLAVAVMIGLVCAVAQRASAADEDPLQDFCVADNSGAVTVNGRTCKAANTVTAQDFVSTRLRQAAAAPAVHTTAGPRAAVNLASVDTFPGLNTLGLSIARIDFPPNGGLNPPHVHPRATEVLFLVQGTLTVGFVSTNNTLFQSTLHAGDLFVFPRGLPHFQINLDNKNSALAIGALNSQNAGTSQLALALFAANPPLPGIVLQNALGIGQAQVDALIQSVH